jgi:hypothetical protein
MRCIACGEEMLLTAVAPDTTMTVEGFEHQTLECPGCGAIERRLVFNRGSGAAQPPPPPVASSSQQPDSSGSEPESIASEPESIAPDTAWTRAVEKLRSRQAVLPPARVDETKKMEWQVQFNRAWEKLAPHRRGPPPADDATSGKVTELAWRSAQALRARLRRHVRAPGHSATERPADHSSPEAIQQFNIFWESLVPGRNIPHAAAGEPVASAAPTPLLPAPLPRSVSLVAVDASEGASASSRAILLLRGAQKMRPMNADGAG